LAQRSEADDREERSGIDGGSDLEARRKNASGERAMKRAAAILACIALASCSRVTGLPAVPDAVTRRDAGLDGIEHFADEARGFAKPLADDERARFATERPATLVDQARSAIDQLGHGRRADGLRAFSALVAANPGDLVLGNAFRMQVYREKRAFLLAARARGERSPSFPDELKDEPLATLKRTEAANSTREVRIQIALCYVDRMMLDPALEVRAPASIDSVHAFTVVLTSDPYNVPALVGRGLNHLNRPRRLVWPEHPAPPENAASQDLGLAAAVGAKVGGASARVKGLLLLLLGDAYAHEGKPDVARSWWTLAGESTPDRGVSDELRLRAGWPETEIPDRLEAHLEERMEATDAPVSDLSFLWDDGARGPW
jgi:hypothetical protein